VGASGASNKNTAQRVFMEGLRQRASGALPFSLRPTDLESDGDSVECFEFRGATIQQKKSNHIGPTGQRSGIKGSQG
jgi:hypothetical protein